MCFPTGVYSFTMLSALPVTQLLSCGLLAALSVTQVWRDFWADSQILGCPWQAGWLSCCCTVFPTAALSKPYSFAPPVYFSPFSFLPFHTKRHWQWSSAKTTTVPLNCFRFLLAEKSPAYPSSLLSNIQLCIYCSSTISIWLLITYQLMFPRTSSLWFF